MEAGTVKWILTRLALASVLLVLLSGCGAEGTVAQIQSVHESVEQGNATSATVLIDVAVGKVDLGDGSNRLMDATFQYTNPGLKPQVTYSPNNSEGSLSIVQAVDRNNLPSFGGAELYSTDLRLSNQLPMSLNIRLGLDDANINLSNLQVEDFEMKLGAGRVTADLSGNYGRNVHARLTGGVGDFTLKVGDKMATRVTVTGNLGKVTAHRLVRDGDTYTNAANSANTLNVGIEGGTGNITLEGP
ncbi:MAG TPA: toast rack family protein [Chloroflexia bacterium]|jgi:hypothetical protein